MKTAISLTIVGMILLVIGCWPIAIPVLIIAIVKFKPKIQKKENVSQEETEVYKTAAEIEHQLNENRYKEETEDKP